MRIRAGVVNDGRGQGATGEPLCELQGLGQTSYSINNAIHAQEGLRLFQFCEFYSYGTWIIPTQ